MSFAAQVDDTRFMANDYLFVGITSTYAVYAIHIRVPIADVSKCHHHGSNDLCRRCFATIFAIVPARVPCSDIPTYDCSISF